MNKADLNAKIPDSNFSKSKNHKMQKTQLLPGSSGILFLKRPEI